MMEGACEVKEGRSADRSDRTTQEMGQGSGDIGGRGAEKGAVVALWERGSGECLSAGDDGSAHL